MDKTKEEKYEYRLKYKTNGVWFYSEWRECHVSVYQAYQMDENKNFGESRKK